MKEMISKDEWIDADQLIHKALLLSSTDLCCALALIDKAIPSRYAWIKECARETVMNWWRSAQPTERDVQRWFRENYQDLLGNDCKLIKRKNDRKFIPDFWIAKGSELIPVECKLLTFDKLALRQLERYIKHYNCSSGIAIAQKLSVQLPDNVRFIRVSRNDL